MDGLEPFGSRNLVPRFHALRVPCMGVYWGYIGVNWGYIGVMLGLYWDYIGLYHVSVERASALAHIHHNMLKVPKYSTRLYRAR